MSYKSDRMIDEEVSVASTPFNSVGNYKYVLIGDLDILNKLSEQGRVVLKHVYFYLDVHTGTACFSSKAVCIGEFGVYDEIYRKRIRRGIKNLLKHNVIAVSNKKNCYWVNKAIIWK